MDRNNWTASVHKSAKVVSASKVDEKPGSGQHRVKSKIAYSEINEQTMSFLASSDLANLKRLLRGTIPTAPTREEVMARRLED